MKLLTPELKAQLRANWDQRVRDGKEYDCKPVVKLFNPMGRGTWLFTELSDDGDTLFGLCDLGAPELGYASLSEIESYPGIWGIGIERDLHFEATKTLSEYATEARWEGRIVT